MCAPSVLTSAASVACASSRYRMTSSRPTSSCFGSVIVSMRPASPGTRAAKRVPSRPVAPKRVEVEIGGRRLSLSNLDKVLYPKAGFAKGQVIDYYTRVAPALLPHLRGRPLTLKRYPNGVEGEY